MEVKLLRKDAYMDYEIYTFDVKNNTEKTSILGRVNDAENVSYLIDKNGLKYNAYVHEIPQNLLEILGKQEKTIQIKYFSEYSSSRKLKKLVFPKIYFLNEFNNISITFEL